MFVNKNKYVERELLVNVLDEYLKQCEPYNDLENMCIFIEMLKHNVMEYGKRKPDLIKLNIDVIQDDIPFEPLNKYAIEDN